MSSLKANLLVLTVVFTALSTGTARCEEGVKRALLIGVNKYQKLPSLSGSRNDVEVMRGILVSKFGFLDKNVQVMFDEQATRSAILGALENLVAKAGPHDKVYIHYSGHGSQVEDQNGDEEDKLDETLCPHDARTENVPDITDDELSQILGRLHVASALVVLDSCHSGTALRGTASDIRVRSVPPDMRRELYKPAASATRGVIPLQGEEPYVLFSASTAKQEELDGPFGPNGESLGLLTAALSRALQSTKSDVSPKQLLSAAEQVVEKLKPVFGGYPVPEAQLEGPVKMIELPLFSPVPGKSVAQQEVASPSSRKKQLAAKRIYAHGKDRKLLRRSLPEVEWVDSADQADVVIDCTSGNLCDVFGPSGVVRVARIDAAGKSPDNQSSESSDRVISRIAGVAMTAPAVAELLSIDEPTGEIGLKMSAYGRQPSGTEQLGTRGIRLTASVSNHHIRFYSPNESRTDLNSLQLSVTADYRCYLTLVSVDSAGNVMQLLPNPLQEKNRFLPDGLIQPRRRVLIPDSLEASNRAGFYMDYAPPAGTDTIRAFCTTDQEVAHSLRQAVSQIAKGRRDVSVGQSLVTARGLTGLSPKQSDAKQSIWGAATITVDIAGE